MKQSAASSVKSSENEDAAAPSATDSHGIIAKRRVQRPSRTRKRNGNFGSFRLPAREPQLYVEARKRDKRASRERILGFDLAVDADCQRRHRQRGKTGYVQLDLVSDYARVDVDELYVSSARAIRLRRSGEPWCKLKEDTVKRFRHLLHNLVADAEGFEWARRGFDVAVVVEIRAVGQSPTSSRVAVGLERFNAFDCARDVARARISSPQSRYRSQ